MTKGARMPNRFLLAFAAVSALISSFFALKRRRRFLRDRLQAADERTLWVSLAASLFDSAECASSSRIEIALAAIARRLRLRAGIVTLHGRNSCRVIAGAGEDQALVNELKREAPISRISVYCGSLQDRGRSLAIDYASLSEWRKHSAYRERGWESYIGVNCGRYRNEEIVVSFFDTVPREQLFDRGEKALVEQLAPWIAVMVTEEFSAREERSAFPVPRQADSSIL